MRALLFSSPFARQAAHDRKGRTDTQQVGKVELLKVVGAEVSHDEAPVVGGAKVGVGGVALLQQLTVGGQVAQAEAAIDVEESPVGGRHALGIWTRGK